MRRPEDEEGLVGHQGEVRQASGPRAMGEGREHWLPLRADVKGSPVCQDPASSMMAPGGAVALEGELRRRGKVE